MLYKPIEMLHAYGCTLASFKTVICIRARMRLKMSSPPSTLVLPCNVDQFSHLLLKAIFHSWCNVVRRTLIENIDESVE